MAYNSDGYIMIDFTEVDFRRTNQTIDGLYKRCVDVIGTNKFILVINANGRTPLPATCSFTNNQYVIDTCIYMFAISSNDNLFIRRNDVPASDIIDDTSISVDKTWSSNKIDTELTGKQDTLTAVSPVSINAQNEISVDLSGKQDTLTAGNDIDITDNIISAKTIKSFKYTGNGVYTGKAITIPDDCKYILSIIPLGTSTYSNYDYIKLDVGFPIIKNSSMMSRIGGYVMNSVSSTTSGVTVTITDTTFKIFSSSNQAYSLNTLNCEYEVYYI